LDIVVAQNRGRIVAGIAETIAMVAQLVRELDKTAFERPSADGEVVRPGALRMLWWS
jgi:hypothetical protein